MSTTEADEEPASEATEPEGRPPRNVGLLLASAAAVVFALVAIVMVAIVVKDRSKSDSGGDRTEISTTAARVAEAMSSADAAGNTQFAATLEQLGTAPVSAQYNELATALGKLMTALKLQSIRGTVKEVYVGNIEDSEARVVVRLDLVYVGEKTRVIPDQYLDLSLAKLDGVWKVDNAQPLNVVLAGGAPTTTLPGTPATTPTTASSGG